MPSVSLEDMSPKLIIQFDWRELEWIFNGNTWTYRIPLAKDRSEREKDIIVTIHSEAPGAATP